MTEFPMLDISPLRSEHDCREVATARNFLQSKFWGFFKSKTGWQAFECSYALGNGSQGRALLLRKRIGRFFSFLYIPFGLQELETETDKWHLLSELLFAIGAALGKNDIFVRIDLPWKKSIDLPTASPGNLSFNKKNGRRVFKGVDVQVPDTVVLDISKTEDEILKSMKAKWRYNIRLAEKKGVQVTEEGEKGLDEFMQLYRETSKRDKIAIHSTSYYRTLFQTVSQIRNTVSENSPIENLPELSLYIARHEGHAIAGIIVLRYGRTSTYLYGASSDQKRNLMPAYALQWYAVQDARRKGATSYDLFGIPPEAKDDSHPMAGLYLFKMGFGGEIVHRYGAYDVALHPVVYKIFRASEAMRLMWHKKIKKKLRKVFHKIEIH